MNECILYSKRRGPVPKTWQIEYSDEWARNPNRIGFSLGYDQTPSKGWNEYRTFENQIHNEDVSSLAWRCSLRSTCTH